MSLAAPLWLPGYRLALQAATPLLNRVLARRAARGKEVPERLGERRGEASLPRPPGPLIWVHAASVGEAQAALPLIQRLLRRDPRWHVLLTTGTVTSAHLMADRLPARAIHQFLPLDHPRWAARFLNHWRPDLVLWTESDFWPALLLEIANRQIPAALVNGRLSPRSMARWRHVPFIIRPMLQAFRVVLMQTDAMAEGLAALGAEGASSPGNLKFAADAPPVDPEAQAAIARWRNGRPLVALLSSHQGEETSFAEAWRVLAERSRAAGGAAPAAILLPRHPDRGAEIQAALQPLVLTARSSAGEADPATPILIHDRLGETGAVLAETHVAIIGGSFVEHGGHNPIEAALMGVPSIFGPWMFNFKGVVEVLMTAEAATGAATMEGALSVAADLLANPARHQAMRRAALRVGAAEAPVLDRVMAALDPLLKPLSAA